MVTVDEGQPRIEIELTPRRERGRRARLPGRAAGPAVERGAAVHHVDVEPVTEHDLLRTHGSPPPPTPAPSVGWPGSDRGRLVATAAVAGVVALLLGWVLGRSGGDDAVGEAGPVAATTTEPNRTDTTRPSLLPGVTIAPLPPTTRAPTTTLPAIEIATSELDPRLRALGDTTLRLVGWTPGQLVEVDLATGRSVTRRLSGVGGGVDPGLVRIGSDWVLVPSSDGLSFRLVDDDGVALTGLGSDPWSLVWIPGTDLFWRPVDIGQQGFGEPVTFEEVHVDGTPTGRTVELPFSAWAWIGDPAGGVITTIAGGAYSITPEGATLIGRGDLVAIGNRRALLRTCDESMACGLAVVDRATGASRPLGDPGTQGVQIESVYNWSSGRPDSMSPDERFATVMAFDGQAQQLSLLDLETGELVPLADGYQPVVSWAPDASLAFFLDGETPSAYDPATGESFPVFPDATGWQALGVRIGAAPAVTEEPAGSGAGAIDGGSTAVLVPSATTEQPVEG